MPDGGLAEPELSTRPLGPGGQYLVRWEDSERLTTPVTRSPVGRTDLLTSSFIRLIIIFLVQGSLANVQ